MKAKRIKATTTNRSYYNSEEVEMLKKTIAENPDVSIRTLAGDISTSLARSKCSVLLKMNQLNKKFRIRNGRCDQWSDKSIKELAEMYNSSHYGELAERVEKFAVESGRTVNSVRNQLCRLMSKGMIRRMTKPSSIQLPASSLQEVLSLSAKREAYNGGGRPQPTSSQGFVIEGSFRKIEHSGDCIKVYF